MGAGWTWSGLDELKQALRELPAVLSADASTIIERRATESAETVRAAYLAHRDTGDLADHVTVKTVRTQFGTASTVKSSGKIAWLFDNGSQARHYVTAHGATHPTGAMWGKTPAPHTFVNTMSAGRREMYGELAELLRREGLVVREIDE